MISKTPILIKRLLWICGILLIVLALAMFAGISSGPAGGGWASVYQLLAGTGDMDSTLSTIILKIRLPRVFLAALVGATLSLGGLVFQALLRNPLAEPFILGVSGGAAIGAIIGILLGLSYFPGVSTTAFLGSTGTLALILFLTAGQSFVKKESLLLSGVMVNAFCSAVIMFLISVIQDTRLHNIIFWLMGDLSSADNRQVGLLAMMLAPCFVLLFWFSHTMNLLLMGKDMAQTMGVNIKAVTLMLLVVSSFMVSATVSYCGLVGFVGLVIPHLLRRLLGADHRILVPACVLGGGAYLVICDILARTLARQGEMPTGVVTAIIGAPLFIFLFEEIKQMNPAIQTSNVSHAFAGRPVLENLSFSVGKGQFFIIIGPNGSGKTTLLKIFAGLLRPPEGEIEIFGRLIGNYRQKSLARTIAMVPQQLPLDFPFTVAEAVLMGRAPYHGALGIEREKDFAIAEQAMVFTEVEHLSDRRLDQLSGGEQQRVFIARAICQEPQIMLLDEPTASLDLAHQVRIMDLMERLKAEKEVTVIMVSHDVNIAAMYADQLLLLKAGQILSIGLPREVLSFPNLEESYGCKLLVDDSPLGDFPRITLVPGKFLDDR